jgi:hypothetical protein
MARTPRVATVKNTTTGQPVAKAAKTAKPKVSGARRLLGALLDIRHSIPAVFQSKITTVVHADLHADLKDLAARESISLQQLTETVLRDFVQKAKS